jgi:hypothetical protein
MWAELDHRLDAISATRGFHVEVEHSSNTRFKKHFTKERVFPSVLDIV